MLAMDISSPLLGGDQALDDTPSRSHPQDSLRNQHRPNSWLSTVRGFVVPTSLVAAAAEGNISQVHSLLRANADPNEKQGRAVCLALEREYWPLLMLLVERGGRLVDIEIANAALLRRVRAGDDAGLELVLRAGAQANARDRVGVTPLLWAVALGTVTAVRCLVAFAADVQTRDGKGVGAVAAAAFRGEIAILNEVLAAHGNVESADRLKQTPLQFACFEGHLAIVDALLRVNADVTTRNMWDGDALRCATESNHRPLIAAIIQALAEVNGRTAAGETALFVACARGHTGAVRTLLDLRADPSVRSTSGASPQSRAFRFPLVLDLLPKVAADSATIRPPVPRARDARCSTGRNFARRA